MKIRFGRGGICNHSRTCIHAWICDITPRIHYRVCDCTPASTPGFVTSLPASTAGLVTSLPASTPGFGTAFPASTCGFDTSLPASCGVGVSSLGLSGGGASPGFVPGQPNNTNRFKTTGKVKNENRMLIPLLALSIAPVGSDGQARTVL